MFVFSSQNKKTVPRFPEKTKYNICCTIFFYAIPSPSILSYKFITNQPHNAELTKIANTCAKLCTNYFNLCVAISTTFCLIRAQCQQIK